MTIVGFRTGGRAQWYDSARLDTAVQQTFSLHLSHPGIMCIIQVAAVEGSGLSWSFNGCRHQPKK